MFSDSWPGSDAADGMETGDEDTDVRKVRSKSTAKGESMSLGPLGSAGREGETLPN